MYFDLRYVGVSSLLLGTAAPVTKTMGRFYGPDAERSFAAGVAGTLLVQQGLVALAIRGPEGQEPHRLTLVDSITLSRGAGAALLIGLLASRIRDRRGVAGWVAWLALLYGAILCDWLDGPLARRRGTSSVGALLDMEADSWLTLSAAAAAVAWGELPALVVAPPILRYLLLLPGGLDSSQDGRQPPEPWWVRTLGIVQMLLFIAALAPFGGRATRRVTRVVAPIQTPVQVAGLVLLRNLRRSQV